jgi:peptidyl-prolyl cis-trans isomerase SurA
MRAPRLLAASLLLLAGVGVARAAAADDAPSRGVVDRVVAVVGHDAVLLSDLRAREAPLLARLDASSPSDAERAAKRAEIDKGMLDTMVNEVLESAVAAAMHVTVTADDVDRWMASVAQHDKVSVAQLMTAARAQGFSEASYRDEAARQLLDGMLMQRVVMARVRRDPGMGQAAWVTAVQRARSAWLDELRQATYVDVRL